MVNYIIENPLFAKGLQMYALIMDKTSIRSKIYIALSYKSLIISNYFATKLSTGENSPDYEVFDLSDLDALGTSRRKKRRDRALSGYAVAPVLPKKNGHDHSFSRAFSIPCAYFIYDQTPY
jgi:hypothetical protein